MADSSWRYDPLELVKGWDLSDDLQSRMKLRCGYRSEPYYRYPNISQQLAKMFLEFSPMDECVEHAHPHVTKEEDLWRPKKESQKDGIWWFLPNLCLEENNNFYWITLNFLLNPNVPCLLLANINHCIDCQGTSLWMNFRAFKWPPSDMTTATVCGVVVRQFTVECNVQRTRKGIRWWGKFVCMETDVYL